MATLHPLVPFHDVGVTDHFCGCFVYIFSSNSKVRHNDDKRLSL